ncbi:MAG: glycoside hydrolase family 25 protein [Clostridia bacterium]|nr:glycoside hydrolase family 25 protein [Clostridia bacterium]
MATAKRRRPAKKRTASPRKNGRSGSFAQWQRKWKKFWKKNKKAIQGALGFLVVLVLIALLVIPSMRVSNPGNTYGIDVSSHNGVIEWDEVAENGVQFAVIRAGSRAYNSGALREDARFKRNMRHAWFHHVDRGVYFYSQAINVEEAREEAEFVIKQVNGAALKLPVFLDIEDTGTKGKGRADKLSKEQRTAIALAFAEVIREKGYTPGVYANRWYLNDRLDADALRAAGIVIWLAEYTTAAAPKYHGTWDYWQYSQTGRVPGIPGAVDLDRTSSDTDKNNDLSS